MISPERYKLLDRYLDLILDKNRAVNLTAARTREDLLRRHLDDALVLLDLPELETAHRVLDLGTGGGLPGLPLAIARPDLEVTLLDATRKKVEAVSGFVETLGLTNVRVAWGRAEALGHQPEWRRRFDLVVARAVAPLQMLLELAVPLCRRRGHVVAFKGSRTGEELLNAAGIIVTLDCPLTRRLTYRLGDAEFHLLVFRAPSTLARRFPRDWKAIKAGPP